MRNITISILLIFLGLFYIFTSCSKDDDPINEKPVTKTGIITMYVAPNASGLANGSSQQDAADFLDDTFWSKVSYSLRKDSVEVKFLAGEYKRAYLERPLKLTNLGFDNGNWLILSGNDNVLFPAILGHPQKSVMVEISGCTNLIMSDFHFSGDGLAGYVHRISTSASSKSNNNIIIENCSWKDMRGVYYAATGAHNRTAPANLTTNITYRNCYFARVGIDSHAHHMYHAHNASKIKIVDCHFEDCTGDYVRFRDSNDFVVIDNCEFVENDGFYYRNSPFIAMPLFSSRGTVGDEYFATNYAFTNNKFISKPGVKTKFAIYFGHWGFSPPEYNYLLTAEEGNVLLNGSNVEKTNLIKTNFGIDMDKVRVANNTYTGNITYKFALRSYPDYGAVSLGWQGDAHIQDLVNQSETPFEWEGQIGSN